MTSRQRIVPLLIGLLLATGLVVLTIALLASQRHARDDAIDALTERAAQAAHFQAGEQVSASRLQADLAAQELSGRPSTAALTRYLGESAPAIPYALLYTTGRDPAATFPARARPPREASSTSALVAARRGRHTFSGVIATPRGPVIESHIPFLARSTRRVLVVAYPAEIVGRTAVATLWQAPGVAGGGGYLVDRDGGLVSAAQRRRVPPGLARAIVAGRREGALGDTRYAIVPVPATGLAVALTAPESELTADLPSTLWPRLALIGLALAVAAGGVAMRRAWRTSERLAAANAAKSEFVATASHELRSPLTGMLGFATLLREGIVDPASARGREALDDIERSGQHVLKVVGELLDLTRAESGEIDFSPAIVDVRTAMEECASTLSPVADDKQVDVAVTIAEDMPAQVVLDPTRLRQVALNYLANAIRHAPRGSGVVLDLRAEGPERFRLAVTDRGPGVPAEAARKLFTRYGTFGATGGSGLGLAVCKQIVEAQGGEVGFVNHPQGGATFFASLPCRHEAAAVKS